MPTEALSSLPSISRILDLALGRNRGLGRFFTRSHPAETGPLAPSQPLAFSQPGKRLEAGNRTSYWGDLGMQTPTHFQSPQPGWLVRAGRMIISLAPATRARLAAGRAEPLLLLLSWLLDGRLGLLGAEHAPSFPDSQPPPCTPTLLLLRSLPPPLTFSFLIISLATGLNHAQLPSLFQAIICGSTAKPGRGQTMTT